ncbi:hypothetical protein ACT6NV_06530 [Robiginitalea sp. IMCC44478]|uniref:hypothetical protein n=1 Tax=Robiginitalea sp. IMCC44478 TaxID=3459122 RepID=UPI004042917D
MIRFFRQIRQRLLTENKLSKYLLYVIVEVFIVILGILIAIQIDSWNEQRINRERYEFGIKQLYRKLKARDLTWDLYQDRASFHLSIIDSLLDFPDLIPPERLAGNLLVLDEFLNDDWMDENWFLAYLDFNPTDSIQFGVAQHLHRYFRGRYPDFKNWADLNGFESFKAVLIRENIPICEFSASGLRATIDECAKMPLDQNTSKKLRTLLETDAIVLKLQTLKKRRQEIFEITPTPEKTVLEFIEANFGHLDLSFHHLEIFGSASLHGYGLGVPMKPANAARTLWLLKTTLEDGFVKFRTDENWTFEWGGGEANPDILIFKGPRIPVRKGTYEIVVDLEKKSYEITPVLK